jgi:hypothetical protein
MLKRLRPMGDALEERASEVIVRKEPSGAGWQRIEAASLFARRRTLNRQRHKAMIAASAVTVGASRGAVSPGAIA